MAWDADFEARQQTHVACICDVTRAPAVRDGAWRAFIGQIAPHVETWARQGRALRRCGLDGDDDVRAVLVGVLARLAQQDFANLRAFLARQPPSSDEADEATLIEALGRLARPSDAPASDPPTEATADDREHTPLRGWLRALTRFVAKDHVKQRLGWSSTVRARWALAARRPAAVAAVAALDGVHVAEVDAAGTTVTVEYVPGRVTAAVIGQAIAAAGGEIVTAPSVASKRDVTTDAERWDDVPDRGTRPPITDALALRRIIAEIRAFMATLPHPMLAAIDLWLEDHDFAAIAAKLALDSPELARALVRAGQARLRERFRDQWPELCAG